MPLADKAIRFYREKGALKLGSAAFHRLGDAMYGLSLLAESELKALSRLDVPLRSRLWAYRNGFTTQSLVAYGLNEDNIDEFLPDVAHQLRAPRINGTSKVVLNDKLVLDSVLSPTYEAYLNGTLGVITADGFRCRNRSKAITENVTASIPADVDRVVLKPLSGMKGDGVGIVEKSDLRDRIEYYSGKRDDYLVEAFVDQMEYASTIYPDSTNTIRLVTMVDPRSDESFIAAAYHRFGTDRSAPVDNLSQGGLSAAIDTTTGELGDAISHPALGNFEWTARHPDTGERVEGVSVPNWEEITSTTLEISDHLKPFGIRYAGWDIVPTADGTFSILEANNNPGVLGLQTHEGLFEDEDVLEFYRHHGVID